MREESEGFHRKIVRTGCTSGFGTAKGSVKFEHGEWGIKACLRRSNRIFKWVRERRRVPNILCKVISQDLIFGSGGSQCRQGS